MTGLGGSGVLVSRPRHQAAPLCDALEAAGATVYLLPSIEIEPLPASDEQEALLRGAAAADWLVFVSPNAVEHGLRGMRRLALRPRGRTAAVGRGTARALEEAGLPVDLVPSDGFNSESLLASPVLHEVNGRRIAIIKGEGGRELLRQTLQARGADVTPVPVYRRVLPDADPKPVLEALRHGRIQAAVVTSATGAENLLEILGAAGRRLLARVPVVAVSDRLIDTLRDLGLQGSVTVSREPGEAGLTAAVHEAIQSDTRA